MPSAAVIFDFDGVIASTEDLHLQGYNYALAATEKELKKRIHISPDLYVDRYIVYSSVDGFTHMLMDAGIPPSQELLGLLCQRKGEFLESQLGTVAEPLPGVRSLLTFLAAEGCICGICSGARGPEIRQVIRALGIANHFKVIVSADDVLHSKPDPEGYSKAFTMLQYLRPDLDAQHVIVIEDTPGGAMAAKAAGLQVLGVATSSTIESVRRWATWAVPDLAHLDHGEFRRWLAQNHP
jgi:beta-phosphoglucomutase